MSNIPPPPPSMMPPPPPGYWAPASGYGTLPTKRIGGLATAVVVLQSISLAVAAAMVALQLGLSSKAQDFLDEIITRQQFEDDLAGYLGLTLIAGLVSISLLVLLIIWSFRVAHNLKAMGREGLTWKPGLAIVVWLLGGCTLNIIDFLMLREHWKGSDPESQPGDPNWKQRPMTPLIVTWFVLSLAQIIVGVASGVSSAGINVSSTVGSQGQSTRALAETLVDRPGLVVASGVLSLAAGALMILIVRQLTARHRQLIGE